MNVKCVNVYAHFSQFIMNETAETAVAIEQAGRRVLSERMPDISQQFRGKKYYSADYVSKQTRRALRDRNGLSALKVILFYHCHCCEHP